MEPASPITNSMQYQFISYYKSQIDYASYASGAGIVMEN